jgi:hypothetical protein
MYYDKNGKPIDPMEWSELLKDLKYRRVAETTLPDGKWVSTVWLGLDHSFMGGEPLIFETMVFNEEKKRRKLFGEWKMMMGDEIACQRYFTLEEAKKGHEKLVKEYST